MTDQTPEGTAMPNPKVPLAEAQLRQQAIGLQLRRMFDEVVNEPIPESFLEILRQAEDKLDNGGS
jgi:hypothetical protein